MIKELSLRPFYSAGAWCVNYVDEVGPKVAVFDTPEQAQEWIKANRMGLRDMLKESLK